LKIHWDGSDPVDIRRDKADKHVSQRLDQGIRDRAEVLEMALQVLMDETVQLFSGKDILVGREKNEAGDDPEYHGDVFSRAAMIADDDVRTFPDKIFLAPDFDLFPQEKERYPPANDGLDAFEFLFKSHHGKIPNYSTKCAGHFKGPNSCNHPGVVIPS
jgi:hypothetical protein